MAEKLGLPKPESGTKGNNHWLGRKHSTESKKRISEGVKKAHDEGRGHTWKNRYENPSYAEQWLYGFLDSRNIKYEKEQPTTVLNSIGSECLSYTEEVRGSSP